VTFDAEDFLWHAEDWSDEIAVALAAEAGVAELDETQWRVLRFLRTFYKENGRGPLNRQLAQGTGLTLLHLEAAFPGGIKHGARRLAGLPNPKSCM
jgi:TusE/DsrC/DsvC family sulfur relay protein